MHLVFDPFGPPPRRVIAHDDFLLLVVRLNLDQAVEHAVELTEASRSRAEHFIARHTFDMESQALQLRR